jgi:soluble lytic murein transglycosylase
MELEEKGGYRLGLILQQEGDRINAARAFSKSLSEYSRWLGARIFEEENMTKNALDNYLKIIQAEGVYQDDAAYRSIILSRRLGISPSEDAWEVLSKSPAWMKRLGEEFPLQNDVYDQIPNKDPLELIKLYDEENKEEYLFIELSIQAKHASPEMKVAIGEIRRENNDINIGVIWGERALEDKSLKEAYQLIYPKPYLDDVLNAATEFDVDPYLIWAIMKVESNFRSQSVSQAGAVGLLQIMPDTAKEISRTLKESISNDDLKDPKTNIRFGSYYISFLQGIYKENLDKVLAAYNAGMGTVSSWERSTLGRRIEDFPTAISFFETREYITKVSDAYLIYKWIYQ